MNTTQRQVQRQLTHIRSIDPKTIIAPAERYRYGVKDLKDQAVYRLANQTFLVLGLGTYTETDDTFQQTRQWTGHELKAVCLETGTSHNLEWEEDDEIEVTQTLDKIKFSQLAYDDGKPVAPDSDDLDEIVEEKWEVVYGGKSFDIVDDYAARYVPAGSDSRENVYFYEFEAGDGDQLTIEAWVQDSGKEEFQVYLSRGVSPDDIEVLALDRNDS